MPCILPPPHMLTFRWMVGILSWLVLACFSTSGYAVVYNTDTTVSTANAVTGAETVEVTNNATVQFSAAQNYTGTTTITSGRLILGVERGYQSISYQIMSGGTLELANKSPVLDNSSITIHAGGELKFTGAPGKDHFANVGPITLHGGKITTIQSHNYGSFLFRDNITVTANSEITANYTIRGVWGNGSTGTSPVPSRIWNIAEGATLTVSGRGRFCETDGANPASIILNKTGKGMVLFTAAALSSHSDSVININEGTIRFTNANAFGTSGNALKINVNNGRLEFDGAGTIYNPVSIAQGQSFEASLRENTELRGSLSGAGNFIKKNTGWNFLYLKGDNSQFTGTFTNESGAIFFDALNTSLANASLVNQSTVVFLSPEANMVYPIGSFSGAGEIRPSENSSNHFTVSVGSLNKNETYSGNISDHENGKTIAIEKVGTGTWTLTSGNSNFSGGLTVKNGTVAFTNVASLGKGAVSLTKTSDTEFGKLAYSGNAGTFSNDISLAEGTSFTVNTSGNGTFNLTGNVSGTGTIDVTGGKVQYSGSENKSTFTPSVNVAENTTFQFNKTITYSGNFTGTGTVDNNHRTTRLQGDNTSFEGSFLASGLVYLHTPQSASGKAAYNVNSTMVMVTSSEDDNVYELGSLTGTGSIRPSVESTYKQMYVKVGGNHQDTIYGGEIADYVINNYQTGLIKTGTGMLTLTKDLHKPLNDSNTKAYSLGTTVEAGTLKIARGAAIGTVNGNDLVWVKETSTSENDVPGIILEGRIDGRLQIDGEFILDFTDNSLHDEGILTGELLFGDNASLAIWMNEDEELNRSMSYTLQTSNIDDALDKMTDLYHKGVLSGAFADIWTIGLSDGNIVFQMDAANVPEPTTWLLLLTSFVGIVFQQRWNRKNTLPVS